MVTLGLESLGGEYTFFIWFTLGFMLSFQPFAHDLTNSQPRISIRCLAKCVWTRLGGPATNQSRASCDSSAAAILVVDESASTALQLGAPLYRHPIKPAPRQMNGCDWPRSAGSPP